MKQETILITGGAKRLGRAIALHLAQAGYDIALHYHGSTADAEQTAEEVKALGVKCECFQADLLDHAQVMTLIPTVLETMPNLTGLIHNASLFKPATLQNSDETMFDQHMGIHVKAPFFLMQSFAETVGKGNIITLLDTYINATPEGTYFPYLLSKKVLADLTQMAARNLAPTIRVNGVAPGLTEYNDNLDPTYIAKRKAALPVQQEATGTQIASAVQYLLEAEAITGQILYLDNGGHLL